MARSQGVETTREDLATLAADDAVVLVPTGAVEQHGPHLPVGTDAMITDAVASAAAERAANAVALPVVQFGYSPHHGGGPGTVTLSSETYVGVVGDVLESLVGDGFEHVVVVNGHGGNRSLLKTAASDFRAETGVSVAVLSYWDLIADEVAAERSSPEGGISHGGEMETSLVLYLHETLVGDRRADFVRDDHDGRARTDLFGRGAVYVPAHFDELTETGLSGEPSAADPATGERLFGAAVDALAEFVDVYPDW
jgi:creatinine amidohydrolase